MKTPTRSSIRTMNAAVTKAFAAIKVCQQTGERTGCPIRGLTFKVFKNGKSVSRVLYFAKKKG